MVEFALVAPVIALFVLGTVEFGFAWRNQSTVTNALRSAARTNASLSGDAYAGGDSRFAEYFALDQFRTATANLQRMTLQKLIVFRTTSSGAYTDSRCGTTNAAAGGTGWTGHCNIYGPTQLATLATNKFGTTATGTSCATPANWDGYWCPYSRQDSLVVSGGPDYLGMRSVYTYTLLTKVLPNSTITMTDVAITRIEPQVGA
jgi:Flp pilus assembly protein TadG